MYRIIFILLGLILITAGIAGGYFKYDLANMMGITLTKGLNDPFRIWIIDIVSVCADVCGIIAVIYGLMFEPEYHSL